MADLFAPHLHVSRLAVRDRSQKTAETLLLEPSKNKEKRLPQARQTFTQRKTWKPASHQAKLKKKVFGTRMRKGRTPAGFVPKPLRNRSRKNAETSLLEPIRKKKIYAQTMRNRSQKTAETLLLEPTKNAEKRKMPKRCFWNHLKKKKGCLKQGKPLRNVRLGSLQATRPNSRKRCLGRACEKAEPQQVLCPSHCQTAAGKMPKRRFWNPLKRKK